MDDHPYYLRQRFNVFSVSAVSTLSVTSITAPIISSSTVGAMADLARSSHLATTSPTPVPTLK